MASSNGNGELFPTSDLGGEPSTIPDGADGPVCFIPVVHEEYEVKLDLPSPAAMPSLTSLGSLGPSSTFELNALYFDTPTFDLYKGGSTLRRRSGGADAGWHLKVKRGESGKRREYQGPITGARPPASLREVLPDRLKHAPLIPVVRMVTVRTETPILDEEGQTVAMVSEDQVVTQVRPDMHDAYIQEPSSAWTEIEVEHVQGSVAALKAAEAFLIGAGAKPSYYASKLERALEAWGPEGDPAQSVSEGAPLAGAIAMAFIAEQIGIIQALEQEVEANGVDAVHRVRVAVRRLRSSLKSYGPLFKFDDESPQIRTLLSELRWYGALLGLPRDQEVLLEHIVRTAKDSGLDRNDREVSQLLNQIDHAHAKAHSVLVANMQGPRYEVLQDALSQFLGAPPLGSLAALEASAVMPAIVITAESPVARAYLHTLQAHEDTGAWHELRKKAKRARYLADSLAPLFSKAGEAARRWERVTDELGRVQDIAVSLDTLERLEVQFPEMSKTVGALRHTEMRSKALHLDAGRDAARTALFFGVTS